MSTTYIISKFKRKLGLSITIKYTIKLTMLCMWFLYSYGFIYIMGVSGSCCRYSLRYSHFSFQGENNPLRFYWKYILVIKISMKNSTKMVIFQFYTVTDHLIDIETMISLSATISYQYACKWSGSHSSEVTTSTSMSLCSV